MMSEQEMEDWFDKGVGKGKEEEKKKEKGKEQESKGGQLVCDGSSQVYGDVCKGLSGPSWPAP